MSQSRSPNSSSLVSKSRNAKNRATFSGELSPSTGTAEAAPVAGVASASPVKYDRIAKESSVSSTCAGDQPVNGVCDH